jgi:WD40 repeat protein
MIDEPSTTQMRFYWIEEGMFDYQWTECGFPPRGVSRTNFVKTYQHLNFGTPLDNVWEHYAMVRSGNVLTAYKNGTKVDSKTMHLSNIQSPKNNPVLCIGADTTMANYGWNLTGKIDELRITHDSKYTSNFDIKPWTLEGIEISTQIDTTDEVSSVCYSPTDEKIYGFTANSGNVYEIEPETNTITSTSVFSTSSTERVQGTQYCPINNSILVSSYDGKYRLYSFLPMSKTIINAFNVFEEATGISYAGTTNKMHVAAENEVYEIEALRGGDYS